MKTRLRYALSGVIFVISLSAAVYCNTPSLIRGRIIDPARGYQLSGLTVNAVGWTSGREYQTTSDNVGAFFFDQVEPDTYTVYSDCPGLERAVSRVDAAPGQASSVELVALALAQFDRSNLSKYILSSEAQGGRYPAGNISYLNSNDEVDIYFMVAYFGILILLSIYGAYRYRLVYLFLRYKSHYPRPKATFSPGRLPRITVQLPLYNEMYVAERLIKAVSEIDYPRESLEIQVLDDSTDDT